MSCMWQDQDQVWVLGFLIALPHNPNCVEGLAGESHLGEKFPLHKLRGSLFPNAFSSCRTEPCFLKSPCPASALWAAAGTVKRNPCSPGIVVLIASVVSLSAQLISAQKPQLFASAPEEAPLSSPSPAASLDFMQVI